MSLNIYGTGLDGIKTYKDFINLRTDRVAGTIDDALRATPDKQVELLAQIRQLQNDVNFADKMAKVMVKLIQDINP